ncbi:MAG: cob(I)yrinic acid a,c-diamide adenosyltransferase [Rikenellaceae bacterium]
MRVYTKGGDTGTTSLINGDRVKKYDDRVEAYGTIDELTAHLALLGDKMRSDSTLTKYVDEINVINSMLMNIEAHLAAGDPIKYPLPEVDTESIEMLERRIDEMQSALPSIMKFTIPGGCKLNSLCHICRTVCRRAERRTAVVMESYTIDKNVAKYINRLSDYLYLLGRTLTVHCGAEEILWISSKK